MSRARPLAPERARETREEISGACRFGGGYSLFVLVPPTACVRSRPIPEGRNPAEHPPRDSAIIANSLRRRRDSAISTRSWRIRQFAVVRNPADVAHRDPRFRSSRFRMGGIPPWRLRKPRVSEGSLDCRRISAEHAAADRDAMRATFASAELRRNGVAPPLRRMPVGRISGGIPPNPGRRMRDGRNRSTGDRRLVDRFVREGIRR